jgi:proteasome lid subunit RPN8/RPN11
MTISIRATIRALAASEHRFSCATRVWHNGVTELRRRGGGQRESGAFLLGRKRGTRGTRRAAERFVFYDDLDPTCLDSGIVIFDGAGYGPLWRICRESGMTVVADVHTHPGPARQSPDDRDNPMIATPGHVAIILPYFAAPPLRMEDLGVYEYCGAHRWHSYLGRAATRYLYVGRWG